MEEQGVEKTGDDEKGSEGGEGEQGETSVDEKVEKDDGDVDEEVVEKETEEEEIADKEDVEKEEERNDSGQDAEKECEEIETDIVVVDDTTTDDQVTPTDERLTRRHSRRNRKQVDEAEAGRSKRLRLEDIEETGDDIPLVQETLPAEEEISPEALETRYEAERKRKGKHAAMPQQKKSRPANTTVVISEPEAIRVPFAHPTEEEEAEIPAVEESPFETIEVLVTKRLLEAMVQLEDPKLQKACDDRATNGRSAKSGKKLCLSDLEELGVEKKFISYFKSIGFEWLLNHNNAEVPVALVKEFFTSFKFKQSTDLDADTISFRLFNEEMEMSIREWSLRLGLLTPEEEEEGAWNEREIGSPKNTAGFDAEEAWRMVAHKKVAKFKTSTSKGIHITDPVLRLAQVYIGYNLLGQVGATLTTPEFHVVYAEQREGPPRVLDCLCMPESQNSLRSQPANV
ncbi:myb-like protein X [Salvia hispanica]|uniref:myb-like protein X n=1 Tax=Salvia hispanica TaxID=49212 RepID=UPI0020091358|nr:myb-like protein X [Salvia hispanica]